MNRFPHRNQIFSGVPGRIAHALDRTLARLPSIYGTPPMAVFAWRQRRRVIVGLVCCLLAILFAAYLGAGVPSARAQGDGDKAAPAADKPADSAENPEHEGPGFGKIFLHMLRSLGYFAPIMALVSIALVFLIVLLTMDLRMSVAIPPGFVEDFTDKVNKRRFKEAFDSARQDGSFLARVLTTGMSRLQYGLEDAREAAMNMIETIKASKEQLITYLATIGTLGPMLGLVGTVFGMILAFMELGRSGNPDYRRLADSLSQALVVTLVGIALSVPAIFCHAFFRNRLIKLTMDTSNVADDLLTQMYHNSKRPGTTPAVPTANAAPQPATIRAGE